MWFGGGTVIWRAGLVCVLVAAGGGAWGEDLPRGAIASPLMDLAERVAVEHHGLTAAQDGHYAGVVEYPYDALLLRVHLIRAARRSIDLQTFIWEAGDASAKLIAYELVQAAKRGVQVRVLLDHMWSAKATDEITFDETTFPGVEIKIYRPPAKWLNPGTPWRVLNMILPTAANQRMHCKTMIVDGILGFTGGRNIGDKYFGLAMGYNFKDREVLVAGPRVAEMSRSFDAYWRFKRTYFNYELRDVAKLLEEGKTQPEVAREEIGYDTTFAEVDRDANDPETIQRAFVDGMRPVDGLWWVADAPGKKADFAYTAIGTSSQMAHGFWSQLEVTRDELLMQSPYTIFDFRARHLFKEYTEESPDLRVVLSTNSLGSADHIVTYSANFRLRTKMIRGLGFEIYEMKPHPAIRDTHLPRFYELKTRADNGEGDEPYLSIHSKTFVFDRRVVYIGTMNLDPRSFYVNSECGIFIDDAAFAGELRATLLEDMGARNSWVIARNQYILGFVNRSLETISSTLPIDPWPIRNTAAYELKPGAEEVPSEHPDFYENYESVGSFPGTSPADQRRITTTIYKTFGMAATPLL